MFPAATAALGWLIAKCPDQAASDIQEWTRNDGSGRQWDLTWLQDIFAATLTDLQHHASYQAVWKAEQKLLHQLGKLEQELDDALRSICDHYEGGEPLV